MRRGFANRRSLAALPVVVLGLGAFFLLAFGAALAAVERFGARLAGAFVSDAAPVFQIGCLLNVLPVDDVDFSLRSP